MFDPLDQITPLILTYNEDANINRTLAGLAWARRIVVVDSGSTDRTLELLASWPQVEVIQRRFDGFAQQCGFGLSQIHTEWCLSLDADHVIRPDFVQEMATVIRGADSDLVAIKTPFRYCVFGKPLRGALLPPRFNLIRPAGGCYQNDGHSHHFVPAGATSTMQAAIWHDDRKPLDRWFQSQQRYLRQELQKLRSTRASQLSFADRIRRHKLLAPPIVFVLCLVWHRGLLDGWRGWFYALQRTYVELLFSLMLIEAEYGGDQR